MGPAGTHLGILITTVHYDHMAHVDGRSHHRDGDSGAGAAGPGAQQQQFFLQFVTKYMHYRYGHKARVRNGCQVSWMGLCFVCMDTREGISKPVLSLLQHCLRPSVLASG